MHFSFWNPIHCHLYDEPNNFCQSDLAKLYSDSPSRRFGWKLNERTCQWKRKWKFGNEGDRAHTLPRCDSMDGWLRNAKLEPTEEKKWLTQIHVSFHTEWCDLTTQVSPRFSLWQRLTTKMWLVILFVGLVFSSKTEWRHLICQSECAKIGQIWLKMAIKMTFGHRVFCQQWRESERKSSSQSLQQAKSKSWGFRPLFCCH